MIRRRPKPKRELPSHAVLDLRDKVQPVHGRHCNCHQCRPRPSEK